MNREYYSTSNAISNQFFLDQYLDIEKNIPYGILWFRIIIALFQNEILLRKNNHYFILNHKCQFIKSLYIKIIRSRKMKSCFGIICLLWNNERWLSIRMTNAFYTIFHLKIKPRRHRFSITIPKICRQSPANRMLSQ